MWKKFLTGIVIFGILFSNQNVFATESNAKTLSGSVEKNRDVRIPDEIILIPIDESSVNIEDLKKNNTLDLSQLKELKVADPKKVMDTKERLYRATTFLMLGGLSVSGNIERAIGRGESARRLGDNWKNPIRSGKDGWKADDNPFLINYVGHPLEWFLLANYLKASGASDKEALVISQLVNVAWEFAVEGAYIPISPKDLVSDSVGALLGIYCYNKFLSNYSNATYNKLADIGEKYNLGFSPQFKYNPNTKGMMFGALLKIKK